MKNKRILWRTLGVFAVIALIGFAVASCEVEGGGSGHDCRNGRNCRWGEWVWDGQPADCTTGGTRISTCIYCSNTRAPQTMNPLGCSFGDWEEVTPVTCEYPGLRTRTCIRCGEIGQNVLHALGHAWSPLMIVTAPTPTQPGWGRIECTRLNCPIFDEGPLSYTGGGI